MGGKKGEQLDIKTLAKDSDEDDILEIDRTGSRVTFEQKKRHNYLFKNAQAGFESDEEMEYELSEEMNTIYDSSSSVLNKLNLDRNHESCVSERNLIEQPGYKIDNCESSEDVETEDDLKMEICQNKESNNSVKLTKKRSNDKREKDKEKYNLSSKIEVSMTCRPLLVMTNPKNLSQDRAEQMAFLQNSKPLHETDQITSVNFRTSHSKDPVPGLSSMRQIKKLHRQERAKTKGANWFNMPVAEMDEAKKNDLMMLQYREAWDKKQFYKRSDSKVLPKYFQVGTVMDAPKDFYSSRVPKKQRRATMVEELLADAEFKTYVKRKYNEIVNRRPNPAGRKHKQSSGEKIEKFKGSKEKKFKGSKEKKFKKGHGSEKSNQKKRKKIMKR